MSSGIATAIVDFVRRKYLAPRLHEDKHLHFPDVCKLTKHCRMQLTHSLGQPAEKSLEFALSVQTLRNLPLLLSTGNHHFENTDIKENPNKPDLTHKNLEHCKCIIGFSVVDYMDYGNTHHTVFNWVETGKEEGQRWVQGETPGLNLTAVP